MDAIIRLTPLLCANCQTVLPAYPDEMAWRCTQCGAGWALDTGNDSLQPVDLHFSHQLTPQAPGRPFWVGVGTVTVERDTFSGNAARDAREFWAQPRRFFLPAFTCSLETLLALSRELLLKPPELQDGNPAPFIAVTVSAYDLPPLAEFVVFSFEAERKDQIKTLQVHVQLQRPEIWVLP
jgi:hypothetical protein